MADSLQLERDQIYGRRWEILKISEFLIYPSCGLAASMMGNTRRIFVSQ
jgi:hypothetical protein